MSADAKAQQLRSLHKPGKPVVLANVYDPYTAEIVASNPSSAALATASFAVAAVHGLDDDDLDLETNLAALRRIAPIAAKHNKPVSIDLQDGYGDRLEEAIEAIIAAGASGCNLEDRDNVTGRLLSLDEAVDRIKRVVATATKVGVPNFALNARTDTILVNSDVDDAIIRGKAYLAAGANTVFVWGGPKRGGMTKAEVEKVSKALDGRINVSKKLTPDALSVQELADIGVARISVGPGLWRKAVNAFQGEAEELLRASAEVNQKV
jgi:2-methylisocitrate lyase-like PEP mutase family enzyme